MVFKPYIRVIKKKIKEETSFNLGKLYDNKGLFSLVYENADNENELFIISNCLYKAMIYEQFVNHYLLPNYFEREHIEFYDIDNDYCTVPVYRVQKYKPVKGAKYLNKNGQRLYKELKKVHNDYSCKYKPYLHYEESFNDYISNEVDREEILIIYNWFRNYSNFVQTDFKPSNFLTDNEGNLILNDFFFCVKTANIVRGSKAKLYY